MRTGCGWPLCSLASLVDTVTGLLSPRSHGAGGGGAGRAGGRLPAPRRKNRCAGRGTPPPPTRIKWIIASTVDGFSAVSVTLYHATPRAPTTPASCIDPRSGFRDDTFRTLTTRTPPPHAGHTVSRAPRMSRAGARPRILSRRARHRGHVCACSWDVWRTIN